MSLTRKTKHRVESILAWIFAVVIIALLIAGTYFVVTWL